MVSCVELPIATEAKKTHNKIFGKLFKHKPEEVQKKREPQRIQRRYVRVVKDDQNVGEEDKNPHVTRKFTHEYYEKQQKRMQEAQERIEDDVFNSNKEQTESQQQQERNRSNSLDRQPKLTKIVNRLFRSKSDSSVKTQSRHSKERKTSADSWTQGVPYSLESCVNTILKKHGSPDSSNDGSGKKCTRFCEEVEILKLDYEDLDKKEIISEPLHDSCTSMCDDQANEE